MRTPPPSCQEGLANRSRGGRLPREEGCREGRVRGIPGGGSPPTVRLRDTAYRRVDFPPSRCGARSSRSRARRACRRSRRRCSRAERGRPSRVRPAMADLASPISAMAELTRRRCAAPSPRRFDELYLRVELRRGDDPRGECTTSTGSKSTSAHAVRNEVRAEAPRSLDREQPVSFELLRPLPAWARSGRFDQESRTSAGIPSGYDADLRRMRIWSGVRSPVCGPRVRSVDGRAPVSQPAGRLALRSRAFGLLGRRLPPLPSRREGLAEGTICRTLLRRSFRQIQPPSAHAR